MKLRLPLLLLSCICSFYSAVAQTTPPPADETVSLTNFDQLLYLLDKDYNYINSHFTSSVDSAIAIDFDGAHKYSLSFTKKNGDTTTPFFKLTHSKKNAPTISLSFRNLTGLEFRNLPGADSAFGSAIELFDSQGTDSTSLLFTNITGNILVDGFNTKTQYGAVYVRSQYGSAIVSFDQIEGNITVTNNYAQNYGILAAWSDDATGSSTMNFSNIKGNILIADNTSREMSGGLLVFSYDGGNASLNISNVEGNITLSGNSAYYGGGIYMEGDGLPGKMGGRINFSDITGNVLFLDNEASSGGAILLTSTTQSVSFKNIQGNLTFEGNKALGKGETGMGGAIALAYGNDQGYHESQFEISNITGDVIFRNNVVTDSGEGAFGGAIYAGYDADYQTGAVGTGMFTLILSADKGNILFEANRAGDVANAIYLVGESTLDFRAQTGRTISFYDPITTDDSFESSLHINQTTNGTEYLGTVLFSGEQIAADSLGGNPDSLEDRLVASKLTIINGETVVHNGTLLIKNGAVVQTETVSVESNATLTTSSNGAMVIKGNDQNVASMTISSGAKVNATLRFEGADALMTLQGGSANASTVLGGSFSGLAHVNMTGGNFTKLNAFGSLKSFSFSEGTLNVGSVTAESFAYDGGSLNLILSGSSSNASIVTIMDLGSVTGGLASSLEGGEGKTLDLGVSFDLDTYGRDLVGKEFELVKIGGELQQYESFSLEGLTCTANSGWLTYNKNGLTFEYFFNGSSLSIGDTVKDVIGSGDAPAPGVGGEHVSIEKETTKGDVSVSSSDPTELEFIHKGGTSTTIGSNVEVTGSLTAVHDVIKQVVTVINPDGTTGSVSEKELTSGLINLVVGEDVSIAQSGTQTGSIQNVHSTVLKNEVSLTLDNTSLNTELNFIAQEGSSLSASGSASHIVIGGGELTSAGVNPALTALITTSAIVGSEVSLSDGARMQLSAVTTVDGSIVDTKLVIHDSTISLGSSDNALGGHIAADSGTQIVVQDSTIHGSGTLSNVSFNGGKLRAGHSPGVMELSNISTGASAGANGQANSMVFQAQICNFGSNVILNGMNSDTGATGNVSQFNITGDVVLGKGTVFEIVLWNDGNVGNLDTKTLESGAKFQFFTFNGGSITGEFAGMLNAPVLADGLMWDISQLTTGGFAQVIWSSIADGSRIANTLWTSGQTVANISTEAVKHVGEAVTGKTTVWLSSLNDFTRANSAGSTTGYDFNTQGYSVGAQRGLEGGHVIGLAFGNSYGTHTPLQDSRHASAGKIKQDAVMGSVYGRVMLSKATATDKIWSIDAYAGYGEVSNKSDRTVNFDSSNAHAKWDDMVKTLGVQANYAKKLNEKTILTPFAGLDFIHGEQDSFTEYAKSVKASYDNGAYYNLRASLGAGISHVVEFSNGMALIPSLSASYGYDICRMNPHTDVSEAAGNYRAYGVNPGRNSFQITPALSWKINKAWSASTNYTLRTRSGLTDQSVNASVSYTF